MTHLNEQPHSFKRMTSTIASLNDVHRGQDALIFGNGPSLQETPLDLLMPENVAFATGKIHLLYDEVEWRPDYYTQNHVHNLQLRMCIGTSRRA